MGERLTVEATEYGWAEKALDTLCGASRALNLPVTRLDLASIERSATSGRELDLGGDHWRRGMGTYLETCTREGVSSLAHVFLRVVGIRAIQHRIQLFEYVRKHPEVRDVKIEKPLFVLGFPRTGTTAVQNLLTLDEGHRGLQFWELTNPFPVHDDPVVDRAKRIRTAERMLWAAYKLAPEQDKIHDVRSYTMEECWPLMVPTGHVLNWDLGTGFADYGDHLLQTDMVPVYEDYKLMLQALLHQRGADRLVLKCPEHLWFLDALLKVFPDACIVWTHRDPVKSIASYCSLSSMQWRSFRGRYTPEDVGAHISKRFLQGVERAMAVRETADPKRFYDVNFHDFVRDQANTVRQVKRYFGLPHPAGAEDAIEAWLKGKRKDKRGAHKYSVSRYGIETEAIYERYASYIERFGIRTPRQAA